MSINRLDRTIGIIKGILPFLENSINESRVNFGERFEQTGEDLCSCLFSICGKDEQRYVEAVKGYVKFCTEHLLLQKRLERNGHYIHNDFGRVNLEVYNNSDVMDGYYLSGLYLSTIFWPNHLRMFLFFLDRFIKGIPKEGRCCEIGVGHGLLTSSILKERADLKVVGIDISYPALMFAEKLLLERNINKMNYDLKQYDIRGGIPLDDRSCDAVIFAEVLEHLDRPDMAMKEVVRVLKPSGKAYITTAVFAASIDHIHLFESADEAKKLIFDSGLRIKDLLILPVNSGDCITDKRVPLNFVCIAEKSSVI